MEGGSHPFCRALLGRRVCVRFFLPLTLALYGDARSVKCVDGSKNFLRMAAHQRPRGRTVLKNFFSRRLFAVWPALDTQRLPRFPKSVRRTRRKEQEMTKTRMRGAAVLAVLVATLVWTVAVVLGPGAERILSGAFGMPTKEALVVVASGAAILGLGRLLRWAAWRPWRWEAARLLVKAVLIAAMAAVGLVTIAWLTAAAVVATVGLVEELRLLVEAVAEAAGVPAQELEKVLVLGAALLLVSKWGVKKRRPRRRRY